MNDQSSDDDQVNNTANADSRGPATNPRKSSRSHVVKPLHRQVRDADTKFGGKLLDEVRQRLTAKPLPLTKQERAKKLTPDIEQLLNEFPKAPAKLIIEALEALEPETDWSTSGREIATVIRRIRFATHPLSGDKRLVTQAQSDRPGATNTDDRRPVNTATSQPKEVMPPRPTRGTHNRAEDVTPGLFGPSSN